MAILTASIIFTFVLFLYNTRNYLSFLVICFAVTVPAILFSAPATGNILCLGSFCYAVGGFFYNFLRSIKVKDLQATMFSLSKSKFQSATPSLLPAAYVIGVTCILLSAFYFWVVGISVFATDVGVARLENRNAIAGSFMYQRAFRVLFPSAVVLLYAVFKSSENKFSLNALRISSLIFFVFLIFNAAFLGFTGIKANILTFLFIPLLIFHNLYFGRTSFAGLLIAAFLALCILLVMVNTMMPGAPVIDLLAFVFFRLGAGATDGLHYVVHTYEPRHGLQLGLTFLTDMSTILGKLGFEGFSDRTLGQEIASELLGSGYRGEQAAVTLSGELYLNFGVFGMAVISLFVGAILQHLYVSAFRFSLTPLRMVFLAYIQSSVLLILGGPVFSMVIDYGVFILASFTIWRVLLPLSRARFF